MTQTCYERWATSGAMDLILRPARHSDTNPTVHTCGGPACFVIAERLPSLFGFVSEGFSAASCLNEGINSGRRF